LETTLDTLPPGGRAEVVGFAWKESGVVYRLMQMGFTPGAIVEIVANYGRGPLVVRVKGVEVAIGRMLASKVLVKPLQ